VEAAAEAAEADEVDLETAVEEAALEADSVIVAVVAREEDEELPVVEDAVDSATGAAEEELAVAVEALLGQRVDSKLWPSHWNSCRNSCALIIKLQNC
jgi:hypothetical protein